MKALKATRGSCEHHEECGMSRICRGFLIPLPKSTSKFFCFLRFIAKGALKEELAQHL